MSTNSKPGAVALIRTGNDFDAVGLRTGVPSNMGWAYTDSESSDSPLAYGNCWTSDRDGAKVIRPLALIDSENDEQVERFIRALDVASNRGDTCQIGSVRMRNFKAALREFATPPPEFEEPGNGGVIVAGDGREWLRYTTSERSGYDWVRPNPDGSTAFSRWRELVVLRVVSEGVTQ